MVVNDSAGITITINTGIGIFSRFFNESQYYILLFKSTYGVLSFSYSSFFGIVPFLIQVVHYNTILMLMILVNQDCYNNTPPCLKHFIFSQFWKLRVQDQGDGRVGFL